MVPGKNGTGSIDELVARHPFATRFVSVGRVSRLSEMPEPEVLLSSTVQRDATMRAR